MYFGFDWKFWVAVIGAIAFKMLTSTNPRSVAKTAAIVLAAVFFAWVFTRPVLAMFSLDPETYEVAIAALLALTGENLGRWITSVTPLQLVDIWKKLK